AQPDEVPAGHVEKVAVAGEQRGLPLAQRLGDPDQSVLLAGLGHGGGGVGSGGGGAGRGGGRGGAGRARGGGGGGGRGGAGAGDRDDGADGGGCAQDAGLMQECSPGDTR